MAAMVVSDLGQVEYVLKSVGAIWGKYTQVSSLPKYQGPKIEIKSVTSLNALCHKPEYAFT